MTNMRHFGPIPSAFLRLIALRKMAIASFDWWLDELLAMVPAWLSRRLPHSASPIMVDLAEDTVTVSLPLSDGQFQILHCEPGVTVNLGVRRDRSARVRLSDDQVLIRRLDLPLAAEKTLRQVLEFDLDRQTPFLPGQAFFDYRVVERRADTGRLMVELAVTSRQIVDRVVQAVRSLGLKPIAIGMAEAGDTASCCFNFLPSESEATVKEMRLGSLLLALALVLAIMALGLWHGRRDTALTSLSAELNAIKSEARISEELRHKIDAAAGQADFLRERRQRILAVAILAELTRLLPDEVWLFEFQLSGEEGRITGYSPSASALIEVIGQSPLLADARFRAPLTKDSSGRERFDLSFRLRHGRMPEASP